MNHKCYDFMGERKHDDGNQCTAICEMGGRQKTITWTDKSEPAKTFLMDIWSRLWAAVQYILIYSRKNPLLMI